MPPRALETSLRFLKQRMLAVGSASGAAWGCCAAIGLVLAGAWLDLVWELSAGVRIGALAIAMAAGLNFC